MTTGDLKNNLRKLHSELKAVSYSGELDIEGLSVGKPSAFLPLLHFVLTEFSLDLAQYFYSKGYELLGKNDMKFIQVVYRILRDEFSAKATLTKEQFFTLGFAERKLQLVTLVFKLCRTKNEALEPKWRKKAGTFNAGKLAKRKLHGIPEKTSKESDSVAMSKHVAMDTVSRNFPQSSVLNSEKIPRNSHAVPTELQPVNDVEGTTFQHPASESRNCISGNDRLPSVTDILENVKNSPVHSRKLASNTKEKQVMRKSSQNSSETFLLPVDAFSCPTFGQNEYGETELNCSPHVAKENIPPNSSDKKSNIQKSHDDVFDIRFSPIPVTNTRVHQKFDPKLRAESIRSKIDAQLQNYYKGSTVYPKDIYFNQTVCGGASNSTSGNEDLTQHLQKLSTNHESTAIVECLKRQQNHIEELQREVKKRDIFVQELAQRNSELSARVMIMETTVALLQEKINE